MQFKDISLPEVYIRESSDFRFFINWVAICLSRIKNDTENMFDLYDPLRCPKELLWMLSDTMGYKYDDRLPTAFNRLVLLYFMSMIRTRGSKDGVTLAAEVNLAQFNLLNYGKEKDILYDRLEDTSIPVNAVYVTPHKAEGYIDVVYFSEDKPIDACIEYVRPVGMYLFQHAGVRVDARTKVSVDARLTNTNDLNVSIGSTHVGHYRRDDYARMQRMSNEPERVVNVEDTRNPVYYRNSTVEQTPDEDINPGYRALYSLQMSNNEHITESLIGPIFSLGYGPEDVSVWYPDDYLKPPYVDRPIRGTERPDWMAWNLRYDKQQETQVTKDVYTIDENRSEDILHPRPAVNPPMFKVGDSISLNENNSKYSMSDDGIVNSEDL